MAGGIHPISIFALLFFIPRFYLVSSQSSSQSGSSCSSLEFHRCNSGQCIPAFDVCDGKVDCRDGSDETQILCYRSPSNKCPSLAFQCAYGACVPSSSKCDGKKDCADNSDELLSECSNSSNNVDSNDSICSQGFSQCRSGECVDQFVLCDGRKDCQDGSDETIGRCINLVCSAIAFRCDYGACIEKGLICNGKNDCFDGSDEKPGLCGTTSSPPQWPSINQTPTTTRRTPPTTRRSPPTTRRTPSTTRRTPPTTHRTPLNTQAPSSFGSSSRSCILPSHPEGGTYRVHSERERYLDPSSDLAQGIPGAIASNDIYLNYTCRPGYILSPYEVETYAISVCLKGSWIGSPTCQKLCRPFPSGSLDLKCTYKGEELPNCSSPAFPNTSVRFSCRLGFVPSDIGKALCLPSGDWDKKPHTCSPVCGVKGGGSVPLIAFGRPTERGEYPWHVGIYWQFENTSYAFSCGGTIVHQYAIITAAHCVHKEGTGTLVDVSTVYIAAGKYYSDWNKKEDHDFRTQVDKFLVPTSYHGPNTNYESDLAVIVVVDPFPFGTYITPICIDWQAKSTTLEGLKGTIVGWGMDETGKSVSEELKSTSMSYINIDTCYERASSEFKKFIRSDKFCASYSTSGSGVQMGDSGGGYTIDVEGSNVLYGIVSLKPSRDNSFAVFTDLKAHFRWLQQVVDDLEFETRLRS